MQKKKKVYKKAGKRIIKLEQLRNKHISTYVSKVGQTEVGEGGGGGVIKHCQLDTVMQPDTLLTHFYRQRKIRLIEIQVVRQADRNTG